MEALRNTFETIRQIQYSYTTYQLITTPLAWEQTRRPTRSIRSLGGIYRRNRSRGVLGPSGSVLVAIGESYLDRRCFYRSCR